MSAVAVQQKPYLAMPEYDPEVLRAQQSPHYTVTDYSSESPPGYPAQPQYDWSVQQHENSRYMTSETRLLTAQQCWNDSRSSFDASDDSSEISDSEILAHATDFTKAPAPRSSDFPPLQKPVALSQVRPRAGQPFVRAWAPELGSHGIDEQQFIEFIDNLNIVATPNAPLQALSLTGSIIGLVPNHWTMLASMTICTAAQISIRVVSAKRTKHYMEKVNKDFFAPRKLRARIASCDEMREALNVPAHIEMVAPLSEETLSITAQERRIAAIEPYMSELSYDVPAPTPQTTMLSKISAKQINMQNKRAEKRVMKNRNKALEKSAKLGAKEVERKYNSEIAKLQLNKKAIKIEEDARKKLSKKHPDPVKIEAEKQKELRKLDEELAKLELDADEEMEKGARDVTKKDKEIKEVKKVKWIIIENL